MRRAIWFSFELRKEPLTLCDLLVLQEEQKEVSALVGPLKMTGNSTFFVIFFFFFFK